MTGAAPQAPSQACFLPHAPLLALVVPVDPPNAEAAGAKAGSRQGRGRGAAGRAELRVLSLLPIHLAGLPAQPLAQKRPDPSGGAWLPCVGRSHLADPQSSGAPCLTAALPNQKIAVSLPGRLG